MHRVRWMRWQLVAAVAAGVLLVGCTSDSAEVALADPKVFYWTDQPVKVQPPRDPHALDQQADRRAARPCLPHDQGASAARAK